VPVFAYLSVLVSIIIGLGMAHLLAAAVRLIHNRAATAFYWPALVWALNLFVLLMLVWWADFSLNAHQHWTFATFVGTLAVPACLYVAASLILPSADVRADDDMRAAYDDNRSWFLGAVSAGVVLSYGQSYLLDGRIDFNLDNGLKLVFLAFTLVPIFVRNDAVQKAAAGLNLAWLMLYVSLLFFNLRES
jgi:hypothetical protein